MNLKEKYNDWSTSALSYDFNQMFVMVFVIYFISTMFDFCLTFITFSLSPDNFFNYEFSFIIKEAFGGDALFCMLVVVLVLSPLIIVYSLNAYYVKRYGMSVNAIRVVLFSVWCISGMHIFGGWTNFFYLINLKV